MYRNKSAIVVGAGASEEYGMPLGRDLKYDVAKALDISPTDYGRHEDQKQIVQAITLHGLHEEQGRTFDAFRPACAEIKQGVPGKPSIDDLLDSRQDNPDMAVCGKIGIAKCILNKEKNSKIWAPKGILDHGKYQSVEDTWGMKFARLIFDGCQKDQLENRLKEVSLIVFNYDRCIEHFLFHYLQFQYNVAPARAAEILSSLEIIHPYGTVGNLPWQPGDVPVPFGETDVWKNLLSISKQIRTYTERKEEEVEIQRIYEIMQGAYRIMFLGFAFHSQNMELLTPPSRGNVQKTYATAKGKSKPDIHIIINEIANKFGGPGRAELKVCKCFELFDEYHHELSMG